MEIIRQSVRIVLVPLLVLVCTAVPLDAERALTAAGVPVFVNVLGNVHVEASDGVPRTTDR